MADAGKFDCSAPIRIGHVRQLQAVVIDRSPPLGFAEACRKAGTRVEIAGLLDRG